MYGRLSETYDAAESVPTQLERGTEHAQRRDWQVVATFKDDGYSAFKEITRDGFGELIAAIEAGQVDVVIVRDIDRLTRNLTDWNAFEKACVRHGVRLSAYTGGDLDLSTPEGAYYGGMETLRAKRESAVKSARVREAADRKARQGKRHGGGWRWFGYTRIYANPEETDPARRHILREEINQAEADAIRDAAVRLLEHGESVRSVIRHWTARGIKPVAARQWYPSTWVGTMTSARIAGLREWQGTKYPAEWPAIIDADTHERLVRMFADPARRKYAVRAQAHLLSGIAACPHCGRTPALPQPRGERARGSVRLRGRAVRLRSHGDQSRAAGGVRDRRGAGCAGISARARGVAGRRGSAAPRRAELLAGIQRAQEVRADARRDLADGTIDRVDWLDIRPRTEDASSRRGVNMTGCPGRPRS